MDRRWNYKHSDRCTELEQEERVGLVRTLLVGLMNDPRNHTKQREEHYSALRVFVDRFTRKAHYPKPRPCMDTVSTLGGLFPGMKRSPASFLGSRSNLCEFLLLVLMLAFSACVKRLRDTSPSITSSGQATLAKSINRQANDQQSGNSPQVTSNQTSTQRMNINTANLRELEKLPGIGQGLAERIIDHRERFGPFRRAEHLIVVRGISDRRFRALRDLITVE